MIFRIPGWAFFLCISTAIANQTVWAQDSRIQPPNVVFIMADDLGYGDLGCFGQEQISTPKLDQMAKEGMKFNSFYAGSTVCAPSRCVLMTGYHTGHCFIRGNSKQSLREKDVTVAELFKNAGYQTCLAGKWGLGGEGTSGYPTRQGFDAFFGYVDQSHAHNYYPTFLNQGDKRLKLENVVPNEGKFGQGVASVRKQYSHHLITDFALDFVKKNRSKPFFLYWAMTIPHANNEAGKKGMEVPDYGSYREKDWPEPQKGHAAMISLMDRDIGRLFDLLKELDIDRNTLVIFTSDNGPHREGGNNPDFARSRGPLRGIKRSLTEGGIRVPTIARWPARIKASTESDHVAGFQDFMPTVADLTNRHQDLPPDLDGVSFLPTLLGQGEQVNHDLFWAFYEGRGGRAIRSGKWKMVQQPIQGPARLYDLSNDIGESEDLATRYPQVHKQLLAKMDANYAPSSRWKFPAKQKRKKQQSQAGW